MLGEEFGLALKRLLGGRAAILQSSFEVVHSDQKNQQIGLAEDGKPAQAGKMVYRCQSADSRISHPSEVLCLQAIHPLHQEVRPFLGIVQGSTLGGTAAHSDNLVDATLVRR